MLLITGRSNCRQNSGLSAPCSWSASSAQRSAIRRMVSASSSANTPTRATKGGTACAITRAISGGTYRRPGRQKLSPIAAAPASTAARASSSRLIPQIFTRTIGRARPALPRPGPSRVARPAVVRPDLAEVVHPHPAETQVQGLLGFPARGAAPLDDDLLQLPGGGCEPGAPLPHRLQKFVQGPGQPLLDLDVPHGALAVSLLQLLHFGPVPVERVVEDEHRVPFDVAGIGRWDPG